MKKKAIFVCVIVVVFLSSVLFWKWDTIFQKGNPVPYLMAAAKLSEETTYAAVQGKENVYISKRGDRTLLFEDFQRANNVIFTDQLGSGYLFTDGTDSFMIMSEIYWGRYTVWTLPAVG